MNMMLPLYVDKTPTGKLIKKLEIYQEGYFKNESYKLQLHPCSEGISIEYCAGDNKFLTNAEVKEVLENFSFF